MLSHDLQTKIGIHYKQKNSQNYKHQMKKYKNKKLNKCEIKNMENITKQGWV